MAGPNGAPRSASLTRAELERLASRAGLQLDQRQLDELAAAAPHIASISVRLPRARPFFDEPAFASLPGSLPPRR